MKTAYGLAARVEDGFAVRNHLCHAFFASQADRLAEASRQMAHRFFDGGRLLAFGRGSYVTDAQHVAVEFVHPAIVGKRALPALDVSIAFKPWTSTVVLPTDMVMGFGAPAGDVVVHDALDAAARRGAMTIALPGTHGSYSVASASIDPFVHQEILKILSHTLWETVHVFFERREQGHDTGDAGTGILHSFLDKEKQSPGDASSDVASSIRVKVEDDVALRGQVAHELAEPIAEAAVAVHQRLTRGGKLITFGNGGSATGANDLMLDCVSPPEGYHVVPAISLSMEAANVTAFADEDGTDVVFMRQLMAHARPDDVVVAFSTSGSSRNVILALEEARNRGLFTLALVGCDGGEIARQSLADVPLIVRSDYTPRIQEIHASIYHLIRELLQALGHV